MAAPPVMNGQNDGFGIQIKLRHQIADQPCTHERMIDRAENDPFGFDPLKAADPRADGRQLALLPTRIHNHQGGVQLCDRANLLRARAEHDASHANARVSRDLNQMFEKSSFAVGKQRFRSSHPAGSPGGENDSSEQTAPFTSLKRVWRLRDSRPCGRDWWRRGGWR